MPASIRRVYVVVVNYRRYEDTIECLESLLRSTWPDFRVLVCENGSGDGSWERLLAWAEGALEPAAVSGSLAGLSLPPVAKPVSHMVLDEREAEACAPAAVSVTFVRSRRNRGFAGGNNLCLKHALGDADAAYFWLLNNDTVVEPDALSALVRRMEGHQELGLCGSTVAFYHRPGTVQALGGGRHNPWLGTVRHVGEGEPVARSAEAGEGVSYVLGASLMASAGFVSQVGLLSEDYFLYFEELDWAARGEGRFAVGHAPDSLVYHKEGRASGNARARPGERPAFADYCGIRSRLLFTRRYHPWALPTVCLGVLFAVANRVVRGQWQRIPGILRLMVLAGGRRGSLPGWLARAK